jgi:phage-related protein
VKDEIKLFKLTLSENMLDFSSQICELISVGRTIEFYKTAKRKCPVEEFLSSLPGKIVQKITWVLNLIRETEKVPAIYLKKLRGSDDIWECRIQFSSNIYRLFFFLIWVRL